MQLRIHSVAIRLVFEVRPMLEAIQRRDQGLGQQLVDAMASVPANIAEGSDQAGKRRLNHYRFAMGSAREVWSHLQVAHALGYIGDPRHVENGFNHVIGTLMKIVRPR